MKKHFEVVMTAINGESSGGVAQLGERLNGIQEVRGSIPLASIVEGPCHDGEATWTPFFIQRVRTSGFATASATCFLAGIAQLVEHNLAKVGVAGSSPVSRLKDDRRQATDGRGNGQLAQLVRAPR
jgi:hypothetical protein